MIQYIDAPAQAYQAGACNIGPAEVRRRRQIGIIGLAASILLGALLLLLDAPAWTRLALALPAAISITGFLQARLRFCAGFGMAGLRNFGQLGEQERVADAAARAADRRKAWLISAAAFGGGMAIAVVFALLPL